MKTPNDYPQIKFRPGKLTEQLSARSDEQTDSAFSQTAKQDLSDYYSLLTLCLPAFTYAERELLWRALNGWLATPESIEHLWVEVEAMAGSEPSGVDLVGLVSRLRDLSRFECWAIYQAVRHGWNAR